MSASTEVASNAVSSPSASGAHWWREGVRWLMESPAEPPQPPDQQDTGPLPGMQTWFKALTAASVLAAAGFIAKAAHEQVLGIPLTDWSILNLGLFAGQWIIDTLSTVLSVIPEFSWYTKALLILLIAPLTAFVFLPARHRIMPCLRIGAMVAVGISLLTVIARYEIPTISLNGWARWDPLTLMAPSSHAGWLGQREQIIKGTFLLSRLEDVDWATSPDAALGAALKRGSEADLLYELHTAGQAKANILRWYVGCVLTFLLCGLACWLFRTEQKLTRLDEISEFLYYVAIYLLIPVSGVLLPYMYGKLICSSDYPKVVLRYIPRNGSPAIVAAETSAAQYAATVDRSGVRQIGLLLESSDSNLRLLDVKDGNTLILLIDHDQIAEEPEIEAPEDVVTYVLERRLALGN